MAVAELAVGQLFAASLLAATFFAIGRRLLRRWRFSGIADEIAFSTGLGMGVAATGLFFLGVAGRLDRTSVAAAILLAHVLCRRAWSGVAGRIAQALGRLRDQRGAIAAAALFSLTLAAALWIGLYPSTSFDATMYHIPFARAFVRSHGLVFLPDLRFPIFPQLAESLFAAILLFSAGPAYHSVEWVALAISGLAVFGWARRNSTVRAGAVGAAVWLGGPIVVFLGGTAMIDLVTAAFFLLAASAWSAGRAQDSRRWIVLSGLLAGFAAATKYQGLAAVLGLGLVTLLAGYRRRRLLPLLLFSASALVSLGPWYARTLAVTGNPVFPLMTGIFGPNAWSVSYDRLAAKALPSAGRLAPVLALPAQILGVFRHPLRLLALPVEIVLDRGVLKGEPPFSPAILPFLPVVLAAAFRNRTAAWLLAFAAALAAMLGTYEIRFLLPAAALFSVASGLSYEPVLAAREQERTRFPVVLLAALLAPGILYAGYQVRKRGPVPASAQSRRAYLRREVPGYAAIELLNRRHGSRYSAYVIYGEYLPAFAQGRVQGQWAGPASYFTVLPALKSGDVLASRLRALGCGYLLVMRDRFRVRLPRDPEFRRLFRKIYEDRDCELFEVLRP